MTVDLVVSEDIDLSLERENFIEVYLVMFAHEY